MCGIFKRINIHGVKNVLKKVCGTNKFKYIYYIDQVDCSDRILYIDNENDVFYDEELFKFLCLDYGSKLNEKVFFFIDNRNVIGNIFHF